MNNMEFKFDSRIMSSSHINFFLGAGVNGKALPQMNGFKDTTEKMGIYLKRPIEHFEKDLEKLTRRQSETIEKIFIKELRTKIELIADNDIDVKDVEDMFNSVNRLILESENRTITTKQVNIFTTNYDNIVSDSLNKSGLHNNTISSSNIENYDKFFDLVGYDFSKKQYIPTYLISKIHGDLDNPILPSIRKYNESLEAKRFEILFRMKEKLSRSNSVLIVIGYSGADKHLNSLIKDAISYGLTVYWFRYDENNDLPDNLSSLITVIDQVKQDDLINTTKVFSERLDDLWDKQLEE